jgi:hypothetical protein
MQDYDERASQALVLFNADVFTDFENTVDVVLRQEGSSQTTLNGGKIPDGKHRNIPEWIPLFTDPSNPMGFHTPIAIAHVNAVPVKQGTPEERREDFGSKYSFLGFSRGKIEWQENSNTPNHDMITVIGGGQHTVLNPGLEPIPARTPVAWRPPMDVDNAEFIELVPLTPKNAFSVSAGLDFKNAMKSDVFMNMFHDVVAHYFLMLARTRQMRKNGADNDLKQTAQVFGNLMALMIDGVSDLGQTKELTFLVPNPKDPKNLEEEKIEKTVEEFLSNELDVEKAIQMGNFQIGKDETGVDLDKTAPTSTDVALSKVMADMVVKSYMSRIFDDEKNKDEKVEFLKKTLGGSIMAYDPLRSRIVGATVTQCPGGKPMTECIMNSTAAVDSTLHSLC